MVIFEDEELFELTDKLRAYSFSAAVSLVFCLRLSSESASVRLGTACLGLVLGTVASTERRWQPASRERGSGDHRAMAMDLCNYAGGEKENIYWL